MSPRKEYSPYREFGPLPPLEFRPMSINSLLWPEPLLDPSADGGLKFQYWGSFRTKRELDDYDQPPPTFSSQGKGDCESLWGAPRPPPSIPDSSAPDGGFKAWSVVLGGFLCYFSTFGLLNSFGTFQSHYSANQLSDVSDSTISWIGSIQIFLLFIGGLVFGPLFDTRGAKILFIPGSILYVLSLVLTSFCTKYYQFILAQGLLYGVADSMLFYPTISAIPHWFNQRRGLAMGIVVAGSSLGGIAWPLLLERLFRTVGFGWACRIAALICFVLLIPATLLVVPRLPPRQHDDLGKQDIKDMFSDSNYVLFIAAMFFVLWGMFLPFYYFPAFGMSHGMSSYMSNNLLATLNAGSLVGRITSGLLADRIGTFNVTFLCALMAAVVLLCMHAISSAPVIIVFSVLYGFFSGGLISLQSSCVAHVTRAANLIGIKIGLMMAICSFGVLTGAPIGGQLIEHTTFSGFIDFAGILLLSGSFLVLSARLVAEQKLFTAF